MIALRRLALFVSIAACHTPAPEAPAPRADALDAMVASERAFAKKAEDDGVREAFIAYLADEAITFAPGPRRGREAWQKRPPSPPKPRPFSLAWAPTLAGISASNDMGYSTGPYTIHHQDGKAPDEHGLFFSVWQKQPNGEWRVVLDMGASTPEAVSPLDAPFARGPAPGPGSGAAAKDEIAKLDDAAMDAAALTARLADGARLYRDGERPISGKAGVAAYLGAHLARVTTHTASAAASAAGDLAYTYGAYESVAPSGDEQKGYYARVWQKGHDGQWQLAFMVMNAAKPEKG